MDAILILNAGSSSLKFQVFGIEGPGRLQRQVKGQIDGIGTSPRLRAVGPDKKSLVDRAIPQTMSRTSGSDPSRGSLAAGDQGFELAAVGHRVVHGGPQYTQPVRLDAEVLRDLEGYIPLAPLHQSNNLAPIRMLLARRPELPQVACFDRHSIEITARWRITTQFRSAFTRRGCGGTVFTDFPRVCFGTSARYCPQYCERTRDRRASWKRRLHVCAVGRPQRRKRVGFTALDGLR